MSCGLRCSDTMIISSKVGLKTLMFPSLTELIVAVHELKTSVPKSANGRIPKFDAGASTIHSAEFCSALDEPAMLPDQLLPVVLSIM